MDKQTLSGDFMTVVNYVLHSGKVRDIAVFKAASRLVEPHPVFDEKERAKYFIDASNGYGYYDDMVKYEEDVITAIITPPDLRLLENELLAAFLVGRALGRGMK